MHWALAVLDVRSRTLHYYDSLSAPGSDGERQLQAVLQWWADESADKLGERTDTAAWKIICHHKGIIFQDNFNDCGLHML
jgi:Ulp1 family protease